jgi:hypothetical protein
MGLQEWFFIDYDNIKIQKMACTIVLLHEIVHKTRRQVTAGGKAFYPTPEKICPFLIFADRHDTQPKLPST